MTHYRVIHKTFNAVAGGQLVLVEIVIECDHMLTGPEGSLQFFDANGALIKAIPAGAWIDCDRVEKPVERSVLES